jgi:glycosyltransferase involved in cell wall biosynthesis
LGILLLTAHSSTLPLLKEASFTEYDDTDTGTDDEHTDLPETRSYSSGASSLIRHYMAFSNTLRANSAVGIVEPVRRETEGAPGSHPSPDAPRFPPGYFEKPDSSVLPEVHQTQAILAIIPAYNEELVIGTVVLRTRPHVDHVIVVDDGSTDKTGHVSELAGAEVIRIDKNSGKAHALMVGFARAREIGCNAVVLLDGDGQHDPEQIPDVVAPVLSGEADMVIGSRFMNTYNVVPSYRRVGQKTLDMATNFGSSFKSTDTQSGFRALSCKALKFLDFRSDDYNIESDMISHFSGKGLRITEVPITVLYDVPNKHKKNPVSHGADVLGHIIGLVGYRRPLLSFGIPGLLFLVGGLIFGSLAFAEYYITSKFSYIFSMICAVFLILGLLLMMTGLILNSLVQIVKMETGK